MTTDTDTNTGHDINERTIWNRGLYMLIFMLCLWLAKFVSYMVVLFQFFTVLFVGSPNERLRVFGQCLSYYIYQIMRFLTFNSEEHPYPLGEWPVDESASLESK